MDSHSILQLDFSCAYPGIVIKVFKMRNLTNRWGAKIFPQTIFAKYTPAMP